MSQQLRQPKPRTKPVVPALPKSFALPGCFANRIETINFCAARKIISAQIKCGNRVFRRLKPKREQSILYGIRCSSTLIRNVALRAALRNMVSLLLRTMHDMQGKCLCDFGLSLVGFQYLNPLLEGVTSNAV